MKHMPAQELLPMLCAEAELGRRQCCASMVRFEPSMPETHDDYPSQPMEVPNA
jgi:hypothetical protein